MSEEVQALTPQQERLCQEAYQNLKLSNASSVGDEESYVFISYKSQDFQTVYGDIVAPLQERHGLRVYCDKAFAATNENWVNQIKENMVGYCCPAVICLITKDYMQSYATLMEIMLSQVGQRNGYGLELFLVFLEPIPLGDGAEFRKFFNTLERNETDTGLPREGLERSTFNELFVEMVEKLSTAKSYPHRNEAALRDLKKFANMEKGESKAFTSVTCFTMMREMINYLNDQNNFFFFYDVVPQARNEFYNSFTQCINSAVSDCHNVFGTPVPTSVVAEKAPEKVEEKPVPASEVGKKVPEKVEKPVGSKSTVLPPTPLSAFEIEEGTLKKLIDRTLTEVVIPDSVTEIGGSAFFGCTSLTSVVIPDSVTKIGTCAFGGCTSLTSVVIPDSVTTIDWWTFDGCTSLTSVVIGDSVTEIGNFAFSGCTSLASVVIPDSVTTIGAGAFSDCKSLASVVIPDSVTTIGGGAFRDCKSLASVDIPDSVTKIEYQAFGGCTSLASLVIPDFVTEIDPDAFRETLWFDHLSEEFCIFGDGVLFKYNGTSSNVVIPPSVKRISSAFYRNTSLTSVVIPDSVTEIGKRAFHGCKALTSVVIPDSVTEIDGKAFHETLWFDRLSEEFCILGDGVLLKYNSTSSNVVIPPSVKRIGRTFERNTSLTSVVIPDSVTEIGTGAFGYCTSLASVVIPDSVTEIGGSSFEYCKSLTSVDIPDSVTEIGVRAFEDCTSLTSVVIGDSVTEIGREAFEDCTSLTSVVIPDSVTEIGREAFQACKSLQSVTVAKGSVAERYFKSNHRLVELSYL